MIIFLGLIDLLASLSLITALLGWPLDHLQAGTALILIGKGAFFIKDILSVFDILIGLSMFWLLWFSSPALSLGLAVYLAFKGLYSFA